MKRCISLLEKNQNILIRKLRKITKKTAELIEIRLDHLKNPDLAEILKNAKLPVIISTRNERNWEKYLEAAALNVAYIDVDISLPEKFFLQELLKNNEMRGSKELSTELYEAVQRGGSDEVDNAVHIFQKFLKNKKTKLIISYHNYKKTPSETDLKNILRKMLDRGADIPKIATQIKTENDNIRLLNLLAKEMKKTKLIVHGMGEKGKTSRILAALLGSEISYLAISQKNKTAKGQWTLREWNEIVGGISDMSLL